MKSSAHHLMIAVLVGSILALGESPSQCEDRAEMEPKTEGAVGPWVELWNQPEVVREIRTILDSVSQEEIRRHLFYLSKDPLPFRKLNYTRPGQTKNTLYEADDYISGQLASWGYEVAREEVLVQAFRCDPRKPKAHQYSPPAPEDPWYQAYNLYAERKGRRSEEIILLLAHKDSQSWVDSPGANGTSAQFMRIIDVVSERKKESEGNRVSHGVEGHGQAETGDVCVRRI